MKSKKFKLAKSLNLNKMRKEGFHKKLNNGLNKVNKIVSQKSGWKKIDKCPICKSRSSHYWFKKHGNKINRCNKCDHGYSTRQPKNISEAYNNKETIKHSINIYRKLRKYRIKRFATERVDILKKFKKKGNLLDYGCGTGWFLEFAKKFYKVTGYEPTKSEASFTSKLLEINVETSLSRLKPNTFDIITMFDVIEHLEDPVKTFKIIYKLLNHNGILFIYTPNSKSISFDIMKEKQNLVIPPWHLQYFNPDSMMQLAKNKFKTIFSSTDGLDIGDMYAYERDYGDKKFSNFLKKNFQILQSFFDHINYSNHLRIIFRKLN